MDWPHQTRAVEEVSELIDQGENRIMMTSPTGGGKSRIIQRLLEKYGSGVVYCNRRMLVTQLTEGLHKSGIEVGVQMAGHASEIGYDIQIASIQTVAQRWKKGKMSLHNGRLVFMDEAHSEKGERLWGLIEEHLADGQAFIGVTATPVGVGYMADHLVEAGNISELIKCGALVPADHFAPDEPDMWLLKNKTADILEIKEEYKEKYNTILFGRVLDNIGLHNPRLKPSILFASGVKESMGFAQYLYNNGIPAGHIDAQKIWINGTTYSADDDARARLKKASETGVIKVVCNRFVLREGVDFPWLSNCIFACVFGSKCAYIQAGGRVLRNHPSLSRVTICDHGGNWWRHGSLTQNRVWELSDTDAMLSYRHSQKYRTGEEPEPFACPNCGKVRKAGACCSSCGHVAHRGSRNVIQISGRLKEIQTDCWPAERVCKKPSAHKEWIKCVRRCQYSRKRDSMTFRQARGLFQVEHKFQVPDESYPLYPRFEADWFMPIKTVPIERLTPETPQKKMVF